MLLWQHSQLRYSLLYHRFIFHYITFIVCITFSTLIERLHSFYSFQFPFQSFFPRCHFNLCLRFVSIAPFYT